MLGSVNGPSQIPAAYTFISDVASDYSGENAAGIGARMVTVITTFLVGAPKNDLCKRSLFVGDIPK